MEGEKMSERLTKGDYVLATKYRDGDPYDGYAVGFFDGMLPKDPDARFMVVDGEGKQYRHNGFRRCERVSVELGEWIVENRIAIEALTRMSPINMWRFRFAKQRAALEEMLGDPVFTHQWNRVANEAATMGRLRPDEAARRTA
jgi:hypothetical protein